MDKPVFIDTHCHLSFEKLQDDLSGVLERAGQAGVAAMITVGTNLADSQRCIELAGEQRNVFCSVGVHPHEAACFTEQTPQRLAELAGGPRVVAIGETGLDYHYNLSPPDAQRRAFDRHLELAERTRLPVIVHCREGFDDVMGIADEHPLVHRVVLHCFTGTAGQVRMAIDRGWMISFTGIVTFAGAGELREAAKLIPADRLMLETDAPYLSPEPVRNVRPNQPAHVVHIARLLAEVRGESIEHLAEQTTANARAFFGLDRGEKAS